MITDRRQFMAGVAGLGLSAGSVANSDYLDLATARREELVELLQSLVRVQSLSGETAEAAQRIVQDYLSDLPYRLEVTEDRPSRFVDHPEYMPPNPPGDGPFVNVVGWPTGESTGRAAMFSHIDTHSMDDGWETPPLEPTIVGNRMAGLGTSDDKGGVAAMLVAASIPGRAGCSIACRYEPARKRRWQPR